VWRFVANGEIGPWSYPRAIDDAFPCAGEIRSPGCPTPEPSRSSRRLASACTLATKSRVSDPDSLDSEIVRLYRAGGGLYGVAAEVGLRVHVVRRRLVAHGVPIRPVGRPGVPKPKPEKKPPLSQRAEFIADLRAVTYETLTKCAAAYGVSHETVREHARKAGLETYSLPWRIARTRARRAATAKALAAQRAARLSVYRQIMSLYRQRLPLQVIADFFFLPSITPVQNAVSYFRKHWPASIPRRRSRRTDEELRQARQESETRRAARAERRALCAEMWQLGSTYREIATLLGYSSHRTCASAIQCYRRQTPAEFPLRRPTPRRSHR